MSQTYDEKQIATLVHGRYLVDRGPSAEPGRPLLLGFHGYGENAERHLEALRRIPGASEWVVCAVGALHRFYNTRTGDVIGSWMTSQQREQAIDDNVRYVAAVISALGRDERTSGVLVLAGFSQGVAMAYRAAVRSGFPCHGLIVLAGDVPPDVVDGAAQLPPILLGRGVDDPLYSAEKMAEDVESLAARGAEVEPCVFDGGHVWSDDYVEAAGRFLERVRGGSGG